MPISDALAGGVGMNTTAYSLLQNIASKSNKHGKKRTQQQTDDESSSSSSSSKKEKTTPKGWMKLDKLHPNRYCNRRLFGQGDLVSQVHNQVPIIGEQSQYGNPTVPEFHQGGPRRLGGSEPGAEKLNFFPQPSIYNLIKTTQILRTPPVNVTVPAFDETITIVIAQQPGIFIDANELILEAELQMYYRDVPWETTRTGLSHEYRKCISPVNNVLASLFKSLTVSANNQAIITYDYSTMDYFETVFQSTLPVYQNGDLAVKGFYNETVGELRQWDGLTGATAAIDLPVNTANPARQSLLRMFYSGQKVKLRTKLKVPITQSLDRAPLNSANRLTCQFQRNPNTYYLLSGPNNAAATAPMKTDIATKAADCKIRINKLEIKATMLEYERPILEKYVNTYTDKMPDTYLFTYHQIQYHTYQPGNLYYQIAVPTDTVPDRMSFAFVDKEARLGKITKNPFVLYRLPKGTKWRITVNSGSQQYEPFTETYDQYCQMRDAMNKDTDQPLIQLHNYEYNDTGELSDCQYNLYCDTLTMTQKNADGSIAQDVRQAAVDIAIELPNGKRLPINTEVMINKYDIRKLAIQNEGVIIKNYNG